jgi:hypothetical protein
MDTPRRFRISRSAPFVAFAVVAILSCVDAPTHPGYHVARGGAANAVMAIIDHWDCVSWDGGVNNGSSLSEVGNIEA